MDIFIVLSSLAEAAIDAWQYVAVENTSTEDSEDGGVNMNNIRVIRMVRVVRLMRLFRIARFVRFIRALRTLVFSIVSTLKSVFWAMMLLGIIIYVFAILFTQAATGYTMAVLIGDDTVVKISEEQHDRLLLYWGSLGSSMISLFMAISNGISWELISTPLGQVGGMYMFFFLGYITFVYFAVLNVVTGVFCQAALESTSSDQDSLMQAFLKHKMLYTQRFKDLFDMIDEDGSGSITKEELQEHIMDEKVAQNFAALDISPFDACNLFLLYDDRTGGVIGREKSTAGGVQLDEFISGCLRLKGWARSSDMARLMHDNKMILDALGGLAEKSGQEIT